MKVYLLIRQYNDTVDSWETVLSVYKDETEAELAALELNERNQKEGYDNESFYVKEFDLI